MDSFIKFILAVLGFIQIIILMAIFSQHQTPKAPDHLSSQTMIVATPTSEAIKPILPAPQTEAIKPVSPAPRPEWTHAWGNLCAGIKLYYGPPGNPRLVGTVLGGNDDYVDPFTGAKFRGVKILYPNGQTAWKDREAMIDDDRWQVRTSDPAIERMDWTIYQW